MRAVVDRLEGNIVVCELEDLTILNVNISEFHNIPKGNDIVECVNGKWQVLNNETKIRKEYIKRITQDMWKN